MKKVFIAVLLLLMVGIVSTFVSALDLQVVGVYTDPANPPVLNQNATIRTDVQFVNGTGPISGVLLNIDFGNGASSSRTVTLNTVSTVYSFFDSVKYTSTGAVNINATVDPLNTFAEDIESNNQVLKSVTVTPSGPAVSLQNVILQGNPGTNPTTSVNLVNNGTVDLNTITIVSSVLTSSTSTIPASAVTISPSSITLLTVGSTAGLTVTTYIPAGQAAGTYTGTLTLGYNSATTTFPITVTVNNVATAPSFSVNDLEFIPQDGMRGQDVSQTLRMTNTGNQALTLNLSSTLPSAYKVRFSLSTVTVNPGASVDVTVTSYVPLSQASGRTQVNSGIVVSSTNIPGLTQTSNTFFTVSSMLEIYKVALEIDGDTRSLSAGDTYEKDLKAGAPIKLTISVRNNFYSLQDIDINDVRVDVRSSGALDVDETDDLNDLSYGDKDSISISTTIPSDAEDGDSYNINVKATGKDSYGAAHSSTYNVRLQVKRTSHEITIQDVSLTPQRIVCSGRATVNAQLKNTGRYNENKVHLLIENADLNLKQRFYDISLDKDDTIRKTYTFNIGNTTPAGQYDVILTSFYNTETDSDTQIATLTVEPCPSTATTNNPNAGTGSNTPTPNYPQVTPVTGASPVYGSSSFGDSTAYVVLLVAGVVVVLAILIILLAKFVF